MLADNGLWIYDLTDDHYRQIDPLASSGPAWSPDGLKLAAGDKIWDATTFEVISTITVESGLGVIRKSWSSDSTRIAALTNGSRDVLIFEVLTGALLTTVRGDNVYMDSVDWSPDDAYFAATRPNNSLALMSVEAEGIVALYTPDIPVSGGITWLSDGKSVAIHGSREVERGTPQSVETAGSAILISIQVWDLFSGKREHLIEGLPLSPQQLIWNYNNNEIIGSAALGSLFMWSVATDHINNIFISVGTLESFDLSYYGGRLAIASNPARLMPSISERRERLSVERPALVKTLAIGTVEIFVPDPTLDRLNAIAESCLAPEARVASVSAETRLPEFVTAIEALSDDQIPPGCKADLLAVAQAIQAIE